MALRTWIPRRKCNSRWYPPRQVSDGGDASDASDRMLPQMPPSRLPELIARRGNVAEYPENTLPALRSALELGARHLSFDVQLSADRHPILLNDSSLKRVAGLDRSALEMTWRELTDVAVTDPQRFAERYTDLGIPRLGQAVDLLV